MRFPRDRPDRSAAVAIKAALPEVASERTGETVMAELPLLEARTAADDALLAKARRTLAVVRAKARACCAEIRIAPTGSARATRRWPKRWSWAYLPRSRGFKPGSRRSSGPDPIHGLIRRARLPPGAFAGASRSSHTLTPAEGEMAARTVQTGAWRAERVGRGPLLLMAPSACWGPRWAPFSRRKTPARYLTPRRGNPGQGTLRALRRRKGERPAMRAAVDATGPFRAGGCRVPAKASPPPASGCVTPSRRSCYPERYP